MREILFVSIAILILLLTMPLFTEVAEANFFNTNNFYPTPIPPAVTFHSPLNSTTLNSTEVCLAFTLDIPAIARDSHGLFVYSTINLVSYSLDGAEPILLNNKTIKYSDMPQAVGFSANLIALSEGSHSLVVSVAYSSFYPAVTKSTSPTDLKNSTINFTKLTQPSPSPTTNSAYSNAQTSFKYSVDTAFLASAVIFTVMIIIAFLLVYFKRRKNKLTSEQSFL
jgi:hypothetical protein